MHIRIIALYESKIVGTKFEEKSCVRSVYQVSVSEVQKFKKSSWLVYCPFIVMGVATTMTTQVSNWSVGLFCGIVLPWQCDIVVLNYQVFIVGVLLWH